jgi:hypothetical protein
LGYFWLTPLRYDITCINDTGNARITGVIDTSEVSSNTEFIDTVLI